MDFRQQRKSMLGNHRASTVFTNMSIRKFEISPKNLQVAESLRKNRLALNNENAFLSNMKNITARQPRRSMLGTRKLNKESLIPPLSETSRPMGSLDSMPSTEHFAPVREMMTAFSPDSSDNNFVESETSHPLVSQDSESPTKYFTPVREIMAPFSSNSCDNSSMENETLSHTLVSQDSESLTENFVPVREIMTPFSSKSCDNSSKENQTLSSPLVSQDSESPTKHFAPVQEIMTAFSPDSSDNSFVENETILANNRSASNNTLNCRKEEETMKCDACESTELQTEDVFKMIDLLDTWLKRNKESREKYQKQIEELQQKQADKNKETEYMENLKRSLIEKLSIGESEKENVTLRESNLMSPIMEEKVFKSPNMSPSKKVIQEMRSTIKFLKTPRMSRPSRKSIMLTPHSMSFSIKSQCERLFE